MILGCYKYYKKLVYFLLYFRSMNFKIVFRGLLYMMNLL